MCVCVQGILWSSAQLAQKQQHHATDRCPILNPHTAAADAYCTAWQKLLITSGVNLAHSVQKTLKHPQRITQMEKETKRDHHLISVCFSSVQQKDRPITALSVRMIQSNHIFTNKYSSVERWHMNKLLFWSAFLLQAPLQLSLNTNENWLIMPICLKGNWMCHIVFNCLHLYFLIIGVFAHNSRIIYSDILFSSTHSWFQLREREMLMAMHDNNSSHCQIIKEKTVKRMKNTLMESASIIVHKS